MVHLIDKDALEAELKKRFDYRVNCLNAINNDTFWEEGQSENDFNATLTRCAYNAAKNEIFELMCFLDALEVKEVNLQKFGEIARHILAVKEHIEDMRLDKEEWFMLEKIGYPERFIAKQG